MSVGRKHGRKHGPNDNIRQLKKKAGDTIEIATQIGYMVHFMYCTIIKVSRPPFQGLFVPHIFLFATTSAIKTVTFYEDITFSTSTCRYEVYCNTKKNIAKNRQRHITYTSNKRVSDQKMVPFFPIKCERGISEKGHLAQYLTYSSSVWKVQYCTRQEQFTTQFLNTVMKLCCSDHRLPHGQVGYEIVYTCAPPGGSKQQILHQ